MWQLAAYYLCLFIAVHQSLADFQDFEIQKKLDGIRDQNTALQESLKTIITKEDFETRLQVLQNQLDGEFLTLQTSFKELQNKPPQKYNPQHIPPKFEQIGSRYFYIENDVIQDWATAGETCRQMGGYLASIQDELELNAIQAKLSADSYYWLGIHNRGLKEDFMSLASGKPATFLKWHIGYPRSYAANVNCVWLANGEMHDFYCTYKTHFICQADKEV